MVDDGPTQSDNTALMQALDGLIGAAAANPADPMATEALGFVAHTACRFETDQASRALTLLRRNHARDPGIAVAVGFEVFCNHKNPAAAGLLRAILDENPDREDRGRACLDLARILRRNSDDAPAKSEALLERCLADFSDVQIAETGQSIGDLARNDLFNLRSLAVGKIAPDITGPAIDGRPLRLADYRGRVVVVVFSGEWCGPCRRAKPLYHALLAPAAQRRAPCAVLEVNTDDNPKLLQQSVAAGETTWPCWLDGGTEGPITTAWGIQAFPTVFVLDARGVIRARDLEPDEVAETVAQVVREFPLETNRPHHGG